MLLTDRLRALAEQVSRNVSFVTRLPLEHGARRIVVSPGNQLSVLKPGDRKFDVQLLSLVDRFIEPGMVVWDVGANMGFFSVPAAHKVRTGLVVSIEPDAFNALLLQRTRAQPGNEDLRMEIVQAAASSESGLATLRVAERGRSANSLEGASASSQMGGVRYRVHVMSTTLDALLSRFPMPNFVKCDAEGAESHVLRGASRVLREGRPVMVLEVARENADAVKSLFDDHNYATFSGYERVSPTNELAHLDDAWDVLAIPREAISTYSGR